MAYVDTRPHELVWSPFFFASTPARHEPLLRRVERDVLLASRRDTISSLGEPTPLGRWTGRMLGLRARNRLADPQLEALRRFAVLLRRRGDRLAAAEQARIVAAGFSPAQIAEIRRLSEAEPPPRRTRWKRRYVAAVALAFAVEAVIFRLASAYFSDGLIGFAFALTTALAGTPLLAVSPGSPAPAPR